MRKSQAVFKFFFFANFSLRLQRRSAVKKIDQTDQNLYYLRELLEFGKEGKDDLCVEVKDDLRCETGLNTDVRSEHRCEQIKILKFGC